jgi:hypothetical protein
MLLYNTDFPTGVRQEVARMLGVTI